MSTPKYAVAEIGCSLCVIPGKRYEITSVSGDMFRFVDENGDTQCAFWSNTFDDPENMFSFPMYSPTKHTEA